MSGTTWVRMGSRRRRVGVEVLDALEQGCLRPVNGAEGEVDLVPESALPLARDRVLLRTAEDGGG